MVLHKNVIEILILSDTVWNEASSVKDSADLLATAHSYLCQ